MVAAPMSAKETPTELFKRALAQSTRALAGAEEELDVVFGAEGPRLSPGKIVLPHPPRVISDPEAERLRGQADALKRELDERVLRIKQLEAQQASLERASEADQRRISGLELEIGRLRMRIVDLESRPNKNTGSG